MARAQGQGTEFPPGHGDPGRSRVTGQQIVDDKVANLICGWCNHSKDGSPMKMARGRRMAPETVRFVGTAVAVVIAETKTLAKGRRESYTLATRNCPRVPDIMRGIEAGRTQLHPEAPGNIVL